MPIEQNASETTAPGVKSNMLWNLLGMALPMLVAVLVVPVMLDRLGDVRFGIVSIAWVLVGYVGVLDLGLGRALTREIADMRGRGASAHVQAALATRASRILLLVGCVWALVLAALAPGLGGGWLAVPPDLQAETRNAFWLVALGAPALMYTNARLAWLEGLERYSTSNAIRIPVSALTMLAPMLASLVTPRVDVVLSTMVGIRVLVAISLALYLPGYAGTGAGTGTPSLRGLWQFSGWLTITNIIGPALIYSDRLYIGAVISAAAVTYYTVPYDVVVRLTSLPFAVLAVLFPRLTVLLKGDVTGLRTVLEKAGHLMIWGWGPSLLAVLLGGPEVLQLWVGQAFLGDSLSVWRWLSIGVFLNGMAFIPYNLIQSAGRSDVTAKFHLVEVPIFAVALVALVASFGIVGAAFAWTLRVGIDTALLYVAAWRMNPSVRSVMLQIALTSLVWATIMCVATMMDSTALRWSTAAVACAIGAAALWKRWPGTVLLRQS